MSESWKDEAMKRIQKVKKLPQDCMKYLYPDKEALANQILFALLKASAKNNEPIKLSEVSETMYGSAEKDKQDVIRLTLEKTLLRCGIVEKLYFAERDVRFFPAAYRFQEVQKIETGSGAKIEQTVGQIVELPRDTWPVPREYFELTTAMVGFKQAMGKLDEDTKAGALSPQEYQQNKERVQKKLSSISRKLEGYKEIDELMERQ